MCSEPPPVADRRSTRPPLGTPLFDPAGPASPPTAHGTDRTCPKPAPVVSAVPPLPDWLCRSFRPVGILRFQLASGRGTPVASLFQTRPPTVGSRSSPPSSVTPFNPKIRAAAAGPLHQAQANLGWREPKCENIVDCRIDLRLGFEPMGNHEIVGARYHRGEKMPPDNRLRRVLPPRGYNARPSRPAPWRQARMSAGPDRPARLPPASRTIICVEIARHCFNDIHLYGPCSTKSPVLEV